VSFTAKLLCMPAALLACAAALLLPSSGSAAGHRATAAASSRLQVTQVEYRLELSETVIKAGPVNLTELDAGKQEHDLRLRPESSGATIYGKRLHPKEHWSGVVDLRPGVYKLWCSLPEHAKLGMHTTLRVVR
jgi:hypothetical protein